MPVIINEVEILPAAAPEAAAPTASPAQRDPADDLRRWLLDYAWRQQRLIAD